MSLTSSPQLIASTSPSIAIASSAIPRTTQKPNTLVFTSHPDLSQNSDGNYINPSKGRSLAQESLTIQQQVLELSKLSEFTSTDFCTWVCTDADRTNVSAPIVLTGVISNYKFYLF